MKWASNLFKKNETTQMMGRIYIIWIAREQQHLPLAEIQLVYEQK